MFFEMPQGKKERVEITSLDSYQAIADATAKDIPATAQGIIKNLEPSDENQSREAFRMQQPDGLDDYLVCNESRTANSCLGIMFDMDGEKLVGKTSFHRAGENDLIRVANTDTNESMQGMGLAERRLVTINAYCLKKFGKPLCSSASPSNDATRLWRKLVERGLAEFHDAPGKYYFSFISAAA